MHMKSSKEKRKWLALMLSLVLLALLAAGCSSDSGGQTPTPTDATGLTDETDTADEADTRDDATDDAPDETEGTAALDGPLYVVVIGAYVSDEGVEALAEALGQALPDLTLEVSGITAGDPDSDPMFAMASMTQLAGRMASGEADLIIADPANGARNTRGDTFIPLADLTGLEDITGREIAVSALDDEGNETGEMLPASGVSLKGAAAVETAMPGSEAGAYVGDTGDAAKTAASVEVINALLAMAEEE